MIDCNYFYYLFKIYIKKKKNETYFLSRFKHRNPEDSNEVPNGFLSDINRDSKKEIVAYIDSSLEKVSKPLEKMQFERIGFFCVDFDTKPNKVR